MPILNNSSTFAATDAQKLSAVQGRLATAGSMIYACKKCEGGVVKRYTSPVPCASPAVKATDPDPNCSGGGDGGGVDTCQKNCDAKCRRETQDKANGEAWQACYEECVKGCGGGGDGDQGCSDTKPCPTGEKCINGKCEKNLPDDCKAACKVKFPALGADYTACVAACGPDTTACPPGAQVWGAKDTKCPCGKKYKLPQWTVANGPTSCAAGYKPDGYLCRCDDQTNYCTEDSQCDAGRTCVNGQCQKTGETSGAGGTFGFSPNLKSLMARLGARANWLLDNPGGMTREERQAIQNRAFESTKAQERPALQSVKDQLARMGLSGSGIELSQMGDVRRQTGQNLASVGRDLSIDEAQRKVDDMLKTTGAAGAIVGQQTTAEQLVEALNAARRGEATQAQQLMLQYLAMLYGNQNSAYQPYWNAILAQGGA